jgi:hypothetical protein
MRERSPKIESSFKQAAAEGRVPEGMGVDFGYEGWREADLRYFGQRNMMFDPVNDSFFAIDW